MTSAKVQRALVSVYDKTGILELCRGLAELGIEILSSGGTARTLVEAGVPVRAVGDYTGFPEMLDGRVKTLHPRIHGGILAVRDEPSHMEDLRRTGIEPIDLVIVNLYPFEATAKKAGASPAEVIEMIDVGGPAMLRAAAKNSAHVGAVVSADDYPAILAELRESGRLSDPTRLRLAVRAFEHSAAYDAAVHRYLAALSRGEESRPEADAFPDELRLTWTRCQGLRYGENPHQRAAFYRDAETGSAVSLATARQLQGKELSFNNILDFDAALELALAFEEGAAVIVKHGNPCGAAVDDEPRSAFTKALECDPLSAFGGVIAFNRIVNAGAASEIAEQFYEGVIAPSFEADAREILARKKNLRLLEVGAIQNPARPGFDLRRVAGGLLVQDWDRVVERVRSGRVVTRRQPTDEEWAAASFAWTVCKHVKSNAIVYAKDDRVLGIGAGQMSRVDSARLGVQKARVPLTGAAMASDAFFPFRDGLDVGAEAGIRMVVQPGGSVRDEEVIAAADEHGMTMVFTGVRHFRH